MNFADNCFGVLILSITVMCNFIKSSERSNVTEQIHKLYKRGLLTVFDNFRVANFTFPCNSSSTTELERMDLEFEEIKFSARRIGLLAESDMKNFFKFRGGTFVQEYMASSQDEARINFPNLKRYRMRPRLRQPYDVQDRRHPRKNGPDLPKKPLLHNSMVGKRRKREVTTDEPLYLDKDCTSAGSPDEDDPNYLHLCSICSAKRVLPSDHYPDIVNEVMCNQTEGGCLGSGNGKCVQTMFNVHLMKRKDGYCRLCMKDDETLAVDEWELYVEPISVGCECMLDKNSLYKQKFFQNQNGFSTNIGK